MLPERDSAMKPVKWISEYGERLLFSILGLIFVSFSIVGLWQRDITSASAAFGLGFLSFIYANVARFKKFKGLGFEAELWEDKKKEAEHLIERLKSVVSIYTQEVVLSKVTAGRMGTGAPWHERWKLYDDLVQQHNTLGQAIDFSKLKNEIDRYFIFDMALNSWTKCRMPIQNAYQAASKVVSDKFGSPIRDIEGYNAETQKLHRIRVELREPFEISEKENLAQHILDLISKNTRYLKEDFGVVLDVPAVEIAKLTAIAKVYESRPVIVTDELLSWADRDRKESLSRGLS